MTSKAWESCPATEDGGHRWFKLTNFDARKCRRCGVVIDVVEVIFHHRGSGRTHSEVLTDGWPT